MKDKLSAFWNGFKSKWGSLAKNLRIFIITAIAVVAVGAIVLTIILNQKSYTAIYTGLDSEECSQIASAINDLGVTDVKIGADGSISVPSDQSDNIRMQLSIQGYPKSTFNFDVWNNGIGIWSTDTEKKVLQIQQLQTLGIDLRHIHAVAVVAAAGEAALREVAELMDQGLGVIEDAVVP